MSKAKGTAKRKAKGYVFTPARRAALRKAQLVSAKKRKGRRTTRRIYGYDPIKRGQGTAGFKKNFTPYIRVNKRSQTLGFNTGSIIPGTGRRLAFGSYARLEKTNKRDNIIDRNMSKFTHKYMASGKPAAVRKYFRENVTVQNPAVRWQLPGAQARLGTSRGAGMTLIVRRRRHPTPWLKSRAGVRKYDARMRTIAGQRASTAKHRKQRRGHK